MKILTSYCPSEGWRVEASVPLENTCGTYIYQEWDLPVDNEAHWIFHCTWDHRNHLEERLGELGA